MKTLIALLALAAAPAAFAETIPSLECTPIDSYGLARIVLNGEKPSGREAIPMVFSSARPDLEVHAELTSRSRTSSETTEEKVLASRPLIEGRRRPSLNYSFEFPSRRNRAGWTTSLVVTIPDGATTPRYFELKAFLQAGDSRPVPFVCVRNEGGPRPGPGASGRN